MVFDIPLDGFDLDAARPRFVVGDDIEMVHCYPIDKCNIAFIQGFIPKGIDIQWDNPELAFYLECSQRGAEWCLLRDEHAPGKNSGAAKASNGCSIHWKLSQGGNMLYRKMQKNGDELSILGFGCMRLPVDQGGQIDEARAIRYRVPE